MKRLYLIFKKYDYLSVASISTIYQQIQMYDQEEEELTWVQEVFIRGKNNDSRTQIPQHLINSYPYNCLVLLVVFQKRDHEQDKFLKVGTGFLVNKNYLITAAHNVFHKNNSEIKLKIKVFPSVSGQININRKTQGENRAILWYYDKKYSEKCKNKSQLNIYDYALVRLQEPIEREKYYSLTPTIFDFKKHQFEVSGYDGEKFFQSENSQLRQAFPMKGSGPVTNVNEDTISYKIDTNNGQSGGPLTVNIGGICHVVGIHYCGNQNQRVNFAIRLTEKKIRVIYDWMWKTERGPAAIKSIPDGEMKYCRNQAQKIDQLLVNCRESAFCFSWSIDSLQDQHLEINGKKMMKSSPFVQGYSWVTSLESFPKEHNISVRMKVSIVQPSGMVRVGIVNRLMKELIQQSDHSQAQKLIEESVKLIEMKLSKDRLEINGYHWLEQLPKSYKVKVNRYDELLLSAHRDGDRQIFTVIKGNKLIFQGYFTKDHQFQQDHFLFVSLKEKGDSVTVIK